MAPDSEYYDRKCWQEKFWKWYVDDDSGETAREGGEMAKGADAERSDTSNLSLWKNWRWLNKETAEDVKVAAHSVAFGP